MAQPIPFIVCGRKRQINSDLINKHMTLCDYGCGQEAHYTFKSGKHCCSKTTSSCPEMKRQNSQAVSELRQALGNAFWKNGHPAGMKNKTPYNKGKTYVELFGTKKADKIVSKLSEATKENPTPWDTLSTEKKDSLRLTASKNIIKRYEDGWMPKAGRCTKFKYTSPVAGEVLLDGTWELETAKWLDSQGLNWKRNTKRFKYVDTNGKTRHYTPDFWIEDWKTYLEIKGYTTALDKTKWSQFNESLMVWKRKELTERQIIC